VQHIRDFLSNRGRQMAEPESPISRVEGFKRPH